MEGVCSTNASAGSNNPAQKFFLSIHKNVAPLKTELNFTFLAFCRWFPVSRRETTGFFCFFANLVQIFLALGSFVIRGRNMRTNLKQQKDLRIPQARAPPSLSFSTQN